MLTEDIFLRGYLNLINDYNYAALQNGRAMLNKNEFTGGKQNEKGI